MIVGVLCFVCVASIVIFVCSGLIMADSTPFYKKTGDFDARFLPLIAPYKAMKPFGESGDRNGWYIDLIVDDRGPKMSVYMQISQVEKVAVSNGVIMAYSQEIINLSKQERDAGLANLHWFVIVPAGRIEIGFETEEDFLAYIKKYGIDKPVWMDTQSAYDQFRKTGCLDWIPDCNQK